MLLERTCWTNEWGFANGEAPWIIVGRTIPSDGRGLVINNWDDGKAVDATLDDGLWKKSVAYYKCLWS